MGSRAGANRVAAARLGLSAEEYAARRAGGEKWCTGCRDWHPVAEFTADSSRTDGRKSVCRTFARRRYVETYVPIPASERRTGGRPVSARDGDVRQARRTVNYLVERGLIPRPSDLPCSDCGHVWSPGERRHEYDHYRGYAAEHHKEVESVCTTCHRKREDERHAR